MKDERAQNFNNSGGVNTFDGQTGDITYNDYRQQGTVKLACPAPPAAPERFGGRNDELNNLKQQLLTGEAVAITAVQGLAGMGKTTLAQQLAAELYAERTHFRAVLWAKISRNFDAATLLLDWGRKIRPNWRLLEGEDMASLTARTRDGLTDLIESECAECGPNRVLVVLDDVWDINLPQIEVVKQALPPRSTILLTTRSNSIARQLATFTQSLDRLEQKQGVDFLKKYLPSVPVADLEKLTDALFGHALAMAIAARQAMSKPHTTTALQNQIKSYQSNQLTRFAGLELKGVEASRDTSLAKALELSYEDLTAEAQGHFRALGAIPFDLAFDLPMLGQLWQLDEAATEAAADLLWQRGLLEIAPDYNEGWYKLHPTLTAYAHSLLLDANELTDTVRRYDDIIIDLSEGFQLSPDQWQPLEPYLPHINAFGARLVAEINPASASQQDLKQILYFAANARDYLYYRKDLFNNTVVHPQQWLEFWLLCARKIPIESSVAALLNELAVFHGDTGGYELAIQCYKEALEIAYRLNNIEGQSRGLNNLAGIYLHKGDLSQALNYSKQSLELAQQAEDKESIANGLNSIGNIYKEQGDLEEGLKHFEQALLIMQQYGNKDGEASVFNNLAGIYHRKGELDTALLFYEQSLTITKQLGNKNEEATVLNNIGMVYKAKSELYSALHYYEEALHMLQHLGNKNGEANTLTNLGTLWWQLRDYNKSIPMVKEALRLFQSVQSPNTEIAEAILAEMREQAQQNPPTPNGGNG